MHLQKTLNTNSTLVTTNTDLVRTNAQLTKDLQDQRKINSQLQAQVQNLSQRSTFWGTRTVDVTEYNQVKQDYQTVKKELDRTKAKEREHSESMERLREANSRALQKVSLYESEAQRAQEHSFKNMSDARWTPRDDSTFANKFTELQKLMRNWAKDYVSTTLRSDALHPDTHEEVLKYLSRVVQLTKNGTLPTEFASPTSKMSEKWTHTLLSAVLAHEIQNEIFKRPFFCLEKDPNNRGESQIPALVAVYNQLLEGMKHSSHNLEQIFY